MLGRLLCRLGYHQFGDRPDGIYVGKLGVRYVEFCAREGRQYLSRWTWQRSRVVDRRGFAVPASIWGRHDGSTRWDDNV